MKKPVPEDLAEQSGSGDGDDAVGFDPGAGEAVHVIHADAVHALQGQHPLRGALPVHPGNVKIRITGGIAAQF